MSVYAEYLHARTEEERQEALFGMQEEARRERVAYEKWLEELYSDDEDEGEGDDGSESD